MAKPELTVSIKIDTTDLKNAEKEFRRLEGATKDLGSSSKYLGDFKKQIPSIASAIGGSRGNLANSEIIRQAQSIGQNIHQGMAKGLSSGQAVQTAANLANQIISKTRTTLGIRSPSTVFSVIGQQIVAGLTQGIRRDAPTILDAFGGILNLGIQAVKTAANFERSQNSLRVFAGSATKAGEELAQVSNLAANTPGLRLLDAETGYKRLRSVGFEAERAQKLLQGLSKEKVLSGADNQAIERVIFNFGQLKVGAQKFSQETREILTQMPSLRRTMLDAFATLNPQKIQAMFDTNPDAFFEKLGAAMAKTKNISSDTIDSFEKLYDEFEKIGREFGKPLLPMIAEGLQNLTAYLRENKDGWASWGTYVSNIAKGIKEDFKDLFSAFGRTEGEEYPVNDAIGWYLRKTSGIEDLSKYFNDKSNQGASLDRVSSLEQARLDKLKKESERIEEFKTALANREFERITKNELEMQKSLRILDSYHSSRIAIISNGYAIESAKIDSVTNFTLDQERAAAVAQSKLLSGRLKNQIDAEKAYFNEKIRLNSGNALEIEKVELEKQISLGKIQTEIVTSQLKSQKEIERIDRTIIDKKRAAIQELNQINQNVARQRLDVSDFNFNRSFSLSGYDAAAFNNFRDQLGKSYAELTRLSSEYYRGQLLNESLTAEERNNILFRLNSDQADLAENLRRKMLEIGDKQYSEQVKQLEDYRNRTVSIYQDLANFYGQIGESLFNPQTFNTNTLGIIQETLLKQSKRFDLSNQMKVATDEIRKLHSQKQSIYDSAPVGGDGVTILSDSQLSSLNLLNDALQKAYTNEGKFRDELEAIEKSIPGAFSQFERLAQQISGGNVRSFDEAQKKFLEYRQLLEKSSLQSEIDNTRALVGLSSGRGDVIKQKEYELKLSQLLRQQEAQRLSQATEKTEQYRNSLQGLTETLEKLRSGDKAETAGFQYLAEQNILREQIGLYGEIVELQTRIANIGSDSAERYQRAWLDAIYQIKNANIEAVESQIQSQVKLSDSATLHTEQVRARVLEHLAEQKSLSESFADGIISAFDKLTGFLNKSLGKIADIPIIGDLAKFFNQQITTNLTKGFLDAFFPSEFVEAFTSSNNPIAQPIVGKLDQTNQILNSIANKLGATPTLGGLGLGSGGGLGGIFQTIFGGIFGGGGSSSYPNAPGVGVNTTPPFNPNFSTSGNLGNGNLGNGTRTGDIVNETMQVIAGDKGRQDIWSNIKNIFSGKDGSLFGKGGIFGDKGFGNNAGTYGAIGAGAGILGSLIGGRVGGFISGAGAGLGIGAQIGSIIMPGIGTAIGAIGGALIGGIASLFSDPKKKRDKKENMPALQKNLADALDQLRNLVTDKNQLYDNPNEVLQKALELRQFIATGTGVKIESGKYQKIAKNLIAQRLVEADAIIKSIREQFDVVVNARMIDEQLNANFATGVYLDNSFIKQFSKFKRRNGILQGNWSGIDNLPSLLAAGEMVLNPYQINAVIQNAGGEDVFKDAGIPNYNTGVFLGSSPSSSSNNQNNQTASNNVEKQPVNITLVLNNSGIVESEIKDVLIESLDSDYEVRTQIVKTYDREKIRM